MLIDHSLRRGNQRKQTETHTVENLFKCALATRHNYEFICLHCNSTQLS